MRVISIKTIAQRTQKHRSSPFLYVRQLQTDDCRLWCLSRLLHCSTNIELLICAGQGANGASVPMWSEWEVHLCLSVASCAVQWGLSSILNIGHVPDNLVADTEDNLILSCSSDEFWVWHSCSSLDSLLEMSTSRVNNAKTVTSNKDESAVGRKWAMIWCHPKITLLDMEMVWF